MTSARKSTDLEMKLSPRNPGKMQEIEKSLYTNVASKHKQQALLAKPGHLPPALPTINISAKMNTDVLDRDDYFYRRPTLSGGVSLQDNHRKESLIKSPRLESISPRGAAASGFSPQSNATQLPPAAMGISMSMSPYNSPRNQLPPTGGTAQISPGSNSLQSNGSFHNQSPQHSNSSFSMHPLDGKQLPQKASFNTGRPSFLDRKPSKHDSDMVAREILANQKL